MFARITCDVFSPLVSAFYVSRVVLQDFLPQVALVDVHVNLGCADVFVSEHRLDGSKICSSFQELRGKAVAEGVGADVLLDARLLGIRLDIDEEGYSAEVLAAPE